MTNYDEFVKEFFYFPGFLQADDQDEVAEDGGAYRNTTNWCLFGEIVDHRPFKVGHTVAVLNTTTKRFLDGREFAWRSWKLVGLAFPMRLADLYQMNTELVKYTGGIDKQNDTRPCQACGKEAQERKKCGGCGYYYYCDTACQKKAWEGKNHKKECKVLKNPNMRMLLNLKATTQALRFTD
ncbi:hypothetical protein HER10_EVM0006453 [Colletotrichum scovillei]|uniref:uncharacterized protein n=1 Tax=Colletotrichum scovillei TaxID=1209932 RepID=UPI0015C2D25E|nr:uncharacterized protein HER10_EVM0006453 [Colletotrichum scovillei]KAF4777726.1 hypothetical protein HER10_EVM0006453 [Colletotrichum scovillei]